MLLSKVGESLNKVSYVEAVIHILIWVKFIYNNI